MNLKLKTLQKWSNFVFVFPVPWPFTWFPTLALAPGHGSQFVFTGPGPQFVFTGPGPQFVFASLGLQFGFTGPDQK